jgi:hypothetical protein
MIEAEYLLQSWRRSCALVLRLLACAIMLAPLLILLL